MSDAVLTDAVLTELKDHILHVTINRPDALNAVNVEVARGIAAALIRAEEDPVVRCVLLSGAGDRVFSAGADLKSMAAGGNVVPQDAPYAEYGFGGSTDKTTSKPIVAAANGSAYGGGVEMLLQSDVVIVERGREFALPEVKVGIFAGAGGVYRLPAMLPRAVALDMLLTGEAISAERMYELGFASRIVEHGEALAEGERVAKLIAGNAPLPVVASKRIARHLEDGKSVTEADQVALSHRLFAEVLASEDAVEGPRAFSEKRAPVWKGK
ncbi:enoyl-CoA hydratase-related protein [Gulosibacter molinativorax]|uniref:Enoyl-CoA hydratase n=1 Tax=Gulosibacter molinativorax TaxID=256821 RepID=A0ABT7CBE6_9MICO|nr:enoyl-CoA hydratase-related protein [Gulosibacter molinativorax]MDJ1372482.1 enoyl-CoA hydratase [Gulosibacter molinativorax]QUY61941.1 Enoyl-CoA hydratase/isomerase family protein [Gulosibacter molinativorax]